MSIKYAFEYIGLKMFRERERAEVIQLEVLRLRKYSKSYAYVKIYFCMG